MAKFLTTDERQDVLDSLAEVQRHLASVRRGKVRQWKWAIIAMANAVNSALVCNLTGTMGVGALEEEVAEKAIAALQCDSDQPYPVQRLAAPRDLLKRAKRQKRIERAGPPVKITGRQESSFGRLFDFRNDFLHFAPKSWVIDTSGFHTVFSDVLGIVEQMAWDGWSFRHLEPRDAERLQAEIASIKSLLTDFTVTQAAR